MRYIILLALASLMFPACSSELENPSKKVSPDSTQSRPIITQRPSENYNRSSESLGQLIYVPVYSHIYQQNRKQTFNLTATLSIRNTDPYRTLTITEVSYYDSNGKFIQNYLENRKTLYPLSSTSFVVEERDLRGGVGANFIVDWQSEQPVNPPVVEAVMISTSQQQGISFLSRGRILQERQAGKTGKE